MRLLLLILLLFSLTSSLTGCNEPPKPTVNLYRSVHIGDIEQIKRHLFWGTDINQPGPNGDFPLHIAVGQGSIAIARELLRHGADVNARNAAGHTPLHVALASGKVPSAKLLLNEQPDDDLQALLLTLVREQAADSDTLEFLTKRGIDVNAADQDGEPPLHLAVSLGDVKLARRLIIVGADVNATNAAGLTPLAIAQKLNDQTSAKIITQLLKQYGAIR